MKYFDVDALRRAVRVNPELDEHEEALAEYLRLEDRRTYLAWVREWKAAYRGLTRAIREEKRVLGRPHAELDDVGMLMYRRAQSRNQARVMLALRHLGKRMSRECAREARRSVRAA